MKRLILVTALALLMPLGAFAQGGVVKYAILLAIDVSDNVVAMRNVIGGALSRLSGRDEDPVERGYFERFILADTQPEAETRIYLGYEVTIGAGLADLIGDLPAQITVQTEFAAPITRTEMLRRLRARAKNDGYTHVWDLRNGSRTDGLIVGRFKPVDEIP